MTRPQPSTSSVEAVARAIDPEAWQAFDEQANRRSWNAFERAEAMIAGKRLAKSLDAACRVLAALPSPEREALEAICACYPKNSNAHRIASQALANPATGDDALRKAIERALAHRYGDWTTILENALASSPAEPRDLTPV